MKSEGKGKFEKVGFQFGFEVFEVFLSSGGRLFQRRGAERLNALLPMVARRAGGTARWIEKEDLRVRKGVATWRRSDR